MARSDADMASLLAIARDAGTSRLDTEMVLTSFAMLRSDFLQATSSLKYYAAHPHAGSPNDPRSASPSKFAADIDRHRRGLSRASQDQLRRSLQTGALDVSDIPSRAMAVSQVSNAIGKTLTPATSAIQAGPSSLCQLAHPEAHLTSKAKSDEQFASEIVSTYLGKADASPTVSKGRSDKAAEFAGGASATAGAEDPEAIKLASAITTSYAASRGSKP